MKGYFCFGLLQLLSESLMLSEILTTLALHSSVDIRIPAAEENLT
jgi:hypothetical protein